MQKVLILAATLAMPAAQAATPEQLLLDYAQQARRDSAGYAGPSAVAGRQFFTARHGDWSCSSCHGANPAATGRHVVTGKTIAALAPAANPERFRDAVHVEKWFRRNCNDTLDRACTTVEKADVLAYLLTFRAGGA